MIEYFGSMKRCQTFAQRHFVLIFSALSSGQYDPLLSIVLTGGHAQYWLISRTARLPWRFPTTYNMARTRLPCLSRSLFMLRSFYWKIRLKMSLGHSLHLETALPVSIAHHVLITHHAYGKIWSEDCVWTKCDKATTITHALISTKTRWDGLFCESPFRIQRQNPAELHPNTRGVTDADAIISRGCYAFRIWHMNLIVTSSCFDSQRSQFAHMMAHVFSGSHAYVITLTICNRYIIPFLSYEHVFLYASVMCVSRYS